LTQDPGVDGNNNVYMQKKNQYYIYVLTNKRNGTLYIGVTNNLFSRGFQHKLKDNKNSFTAKYDINKLVYYEIYKYINNAIAREKQLKNWQRQWKIELIEKDNSTWRDLFQDMM
jgi:putative endonuclease